VSVAGRQRRTRQACERRRTSSVGYRSTERIHQRAESVPGDSLVAESAAETRPRAPSQPPPAALHAACSGSAACLQQTTLGAVSCCSGCRLLRKESGSSRLPRMLCEAEQAGDLCARRARLSKHASGAGNLGGCRLAAARGAQLGQSDVLAQVLAERVQCRGAAPVRCIMVTWQLTVRAATGRDCDRSWWKPSQSSQFCHTRRHQAHREPRLTPVVSATRTTPHAVCGVHIGCSRSRCVRLYACLHVNAMHCTCALPRLQNGGMHALSSCHSTHGTLAPAAVASLLLLACLAYVSSPPRPYIAVQTCKLLPCNLATFLDKC
jgi:hypothetical protein